MMFSPSIIMQSDKIKVHSTEIVEPMPFENNGRGVRNKGGRPKIGDKVMSDAEKSKRYRQNLSQEKKEIIKTQKKNKRLENKEKNDLKSKYFTYAYFYSVDEIQKTMESNHGRGDLLSTSNGHGDMRPTMEWNLNGRILIEYLDEPEELGEDIPFMYEDFNEVITVPSRGDPIPAWALEYE
jgi:hypothetical protein